MAHDYVIFTQEDIERYIKEEKSHLRHISFDKVKRALQNFFEFTKGRVNERIVMEFAEATKTCKYSYDVKKDRFFEVRAFIEWLDTDYPNVISLSKINRILQVKKIPRKTKERNNTVTDQDIHNVIQFIEKIKPTRANPRKKERCLITFLTMCYTGQRSSLFANQIMHQGEEKINPIRIYQIENAIKSNPPTILILAEQDKENFKHHVPVHPDLIPLLNEELNRQKQSGSSNDSPFFFKDVLSKEISGQIPLESGSGFFSTEHPRKWFEQKCDLLQLSQRASAYIAAHGFDRLREDVYKDGAAIYPEYLEKWQNIHLLSNRKPFITLIDIWRNKKLGTYTYDRYLALPDEYKVIFLRAYRVIQQREDRRLIDPVEIVWMDYELCNNPLLLNFELEADRAAECIQDAKEDIVRNNFLDKYGHMKESQFIIENSDFLN